MADVKIDFNCDMGEGFGAYTMGNDTEILPFVTSVNLACGFHGGDPRVMDRMVGAAVRAGVAVGAHPSHWDLRGFGRRVIRADPEEVESDVVYQIGALLAFVRAHDARLVHVKPHGALYNQAAEDPALARAIAKGIARVSLDLRFVGLASSEVMRRAAEDEGLIFAAEAFADRAYNRDGTLQSRKIPGSLIMDPKLAAAQAVRIARDRSVVASDGAEVSLRADTLCIHGDNPSAVEIAWAVRQALEGEGIAVQPLARPR
jgi:UPF0271 protein